MAGHGPEFDPMGYYQTPMVDQPEEWEGETMTIRSAQMELDDFHNRMIRAVAFLTKPSAPAVDTSTHHRSCALRHGGVTCTC